MLDILNLINQSCLLNLLRALLIALLIAGTRSATKIRVTLLIHSPAFTLVLGSQFSLLLFNALSVTSLVGKVLFEVLVDGPVGHIPLDKWVMLLGLRDGSVCKSKLRQGI